MEIREYMKTNVISLPVKSTIGDAARMVVEYKIGALPVVQEDGQLVGLVSLKQLLSIVVPSFVQLVGDIDFVGDFGAAEDVEVDMEVLSDPINNLMADPVSVEADCGLVRAYSLMQQDHLTDLPIVDKDNLLVGIASGVDVAMALLSGWDSRS